jgi:hypothetical protein
MTCFFEHVDGTSHLKNCTRTERSHQSHQSGDSFMTFLPAKSDKSRDQSKTYATSTYRDNQHISVRDDTDIVLADQQRSGKKDGDEKNDFVQVFV